ncbi:MAG: cytochrome P450 [Acetobacteraceae bacterium]|nr:cytochrome P450 [Acetobacteraceae bacterium]
MLRRFRQDMLSVWHERHFEERFFATRLLARRALVCNSPATVHAAFVARHAAFERKSPQLRHALEPLIGDGVFIADGLAWRARRPVVAGVTHRRRLAEFAPAMAAVVAERRAAWAARRPGAAVDMLAEMGGLAAEVICRVLFGAPEPGAPAEVAAAFSRYLARVAGEDLPSLLGLPDWVPRFQGLRVGEEVRRIHAVLDRLVAAAVRPGAGISLVGAMAAEGGLEGEALRNEAATLILAGHETTANLLAWAWFLLSQDAAAAAGLRAEARAALGGGVAGIEDLPRLPFTRAVLEESLRLYPPVAVLARQAVQDTELAGHRVRRGDLVLTLPFLLHRHRALWAAPDEFRPERFLPGAPPRPLHGFIPFSLGPRVCTGAHFAMAEAMLALATLAQDVAPRLVPGTVVTPRCRLSLRPGEVLPMLLERAT